MTGIKWMRPGGSVVGAPDVGADPDWMAYAVRMGRPVFDGADGIDVFAAYRVGTGWLVYALDDHRNIVARGRGPTREAAACRATEEAT